MSQSESERDTPVKVYAFGGFTNRMQRRYQHGKNVTELVTVLPVEEWDAVQMTWRVASVKMHTAEVISMKLKAVATIDLL